MLLRMEVAQGEIKAVVSSETVESLEEFFRFRHAVRNLYGFGLKIDRVDDLLKQYPVAWERFEANIRVFLEWLRALAILLEGD